MKLGVSILSIKDDINNNIKILDECNIDYFHIDIMDGKFVENKTWDIHEVKSLVNKLSHPLDIHMMVSDIDKYVDEFQELKPEFLTFHIEATKDASRLIDKIHSYNIKAGIAINPNTDISSIMHILSKVDLVLVMSVNPGYGGQKFIMDVLPKLKNIRKIQKEYNYIVEVDGGVNGETIKLLDCDLVVVGSFITKGNYKEKIEKLAIAHLKR